MEKLGSFRRDKGSIRGEEYTQQCAHLNFSLIWLNVLDKIICKQKLMKLVFKMLGQSQNKIDNNRDINLFNNTWVNSSSKSFKN